MACGEVGIHHGLGGRALNGSAFRVVPEVRGHGAERGLFRGKVALQFPPKLKQVVQRFFHILGQNILEPFPHALGQNGRFAIGADRDFEGSIRDNAPHEEVTAVGDIRHVQQMPLSSAQSLDPPNLAFVQRGDDADLTGTQFPRPWPPA